MRQRHPDRYGRVVREVAWKKRKPQRVVVFVRENHNNHRVRPPRDAFHNLPKSALLKIIPEAEILTILFEAREVQFVAVDGKGQELKMR